MTGDARRLLVVAGLVWLADDELLFQRRGPTAAHGAGMLELPGGKVEPGEAPVRALERELEEEWGPEARQLVVGPVREVLHHCYPSPGPEVVLLVYEVDGRAWIRGGASGWRTLAQPCDGAQLVACRRREIPVAEFLDADRPLLEALRDGRGLGLGS